MRAAAIKTTLLCWLRLLWNIVPPLRLDGDRSYITAGTIHLPPQTHWRQHAAAAAHAAAHLVHSPPVFDGDGVVPIARVLMGLLEDARVEALAMHELPGLARLWRPLHTAAAESGSDFETLMQRLARALSDPAYDDPDPWIRKGRLLFYGGAQGGRPALQTAADVRDAAMRLGHDIGQMRLQFNAKSYRVAPAYRDDHRWMWSADVLSAAPPPAAVAAAGMRDDQDAPVSPDAVARYPEWDRLIARLRPDWCSVTEIAVQGNGLQAAVIDHAELIQQTAVRLRGPLRALMRQRALPQHSDEGEIFDPGALVEWQVARRRHRTPEPRVYRAMDRRRASAAVWLLIDQSASTADAHGADGRSVLQTAALSAAALAQGLEAAGFACGIAGFSSNGRHAVRLTTVKALRESVADGMAARLQALRPGGSTRLGAALRHAVDRLSQYDGSARWVILLSDGEPYDIDVHDPRYLVEDARHAVRAAARCGVNVVCLAVTPDGGGQARRIFGRKGVQAMREPGDLPRSISRLLA